MLGRLLTDNRQRFRGVLSSNAFNRLLDDVYYDLSNLYKEVNDGRLGLERLFDFLDAEVAAINSRITELSASERYVVRAGHMVTEYPNPSQNLADATPRAFIDREAGVVTLPLKGSPVPKSYSYDAYRGISFVAPDTKVAVNSASGVPSMDSNPVDLIDPQKPLWRCWYSYEAGSAPNAREVSIQVELSPYALTDYKANTIVFAAHPLFTMSVRNLSYSYNVGWQPVPGFQPVGKVSFCRWCFPPMDARAVMMTLYQPFAVPKGTQRRFIVGGRHFGVFYQEYEQAGMVLSRFDVPYGSTVARVRHYFANFSCLSVRSTDGVYEQPTPFFDFELYREEADGILTYLSSWQNVPATRVWVRTLLKMDVSGATPALTKTSLALA